MKQIILILIFTSLSSYGFEAIVKDVVDGDTIKVFYQEKIVYIRLEGIDTPELNQSYGDKSKEVLENKILNKKIFIKGEKKDRYGRLIASIYIKSRWINKELVEEGLAWHYKYYSKNIDLEMAEKKAKKYNLGLWAEKNPIAPWDYRRKKVHNEKFE